MFVRTDYGLIETKESTTVFTPVSQCANVPAVAFSNWIQRAPFVFDFIIYFVDLLQCWVFRVKQITQAIVQNSCKSISAAPAHEIGSLVCNA